MSNWILRLFDFAAPKQGDVAGFVLRLPLYVCPLFWVLVAVGFVYLRAARGFGCGGAGEGKGA